LGQTIIVQRSYLIDRAADGASGVAEALDRIRGTGAGTSWQQVWLMCAYLQGDSLTPSLSSDSRVAWIRTQAESAPSAYVRAYALWVLSGSAHTTAKEVLDAWRTAPTAFDAYYVSALSKLAKSGPALGNDVRRRIEGVSKTSPLFAALLR